MKYDVATPYTAVYALLRDGDKIAFVLRSNTDWMNGYYTLPSGKVEKEEPFSKALVREVYEEVGVTIKFEHTKLIHTTHRDCKENGTYWVDVYFDISEWEGRVHNAEPDKHNEIAWLDLNNLPDNVVPSVAAVLKSIAAGEPYSEYGWDD